MSPLAVVRERLASQRLVGPRHAGPAEAVAWLGAVQAQDYRGSLWGVGLRTRAATELDVERAIAERAIVRTWPMRGTLHLVSSKDVRWMLRLLAPRVLVRSRGRHRQLELDERTFAKSGTRLGRALEGGRSLTRAEAFAELERAGIATSGQRGIHILGALAMQGLLCLGARRERQPTFVLLDEWLPRSRVLERDEALGELARRYFTSHGPATPVDFSWWSGLPLGEARRAVELAGKTLVKRGSAGDTWSAAPPPRKRARAAVAHLLPPWDEFTVAYRDRAAFLEAAHAKRTGNGIFSVVTLDGRVAGTWRRQEKPGAVRVRVELFDRPGAAGHGAVERAVSRYARFLGRPSSLVLAGPETLPRSAVRIPGGGDHAPENRMFPS